MVILLNIFLEFIITIFNIFHKPLLQSSVSYDPSEIILMCWLRAEETFLINFENGSTDEYFGGIFSVFSIFWWIKSKKKKKLFEIKIFCSFTNVIFDQFKAPLLKSINLLKNLVRYLS